MTVEPTTILTRQQWDRFSSRYDLTRRELEVAQILFDGRSEAQAADGLYISHHTMHTHLKSVYGKLGINVRGMLTFRVFESCLYENGYPKGAVVS